MIGRRGPRRGSISFSSYRRARAAPMFRGIEAESRSSRTTAFGRTRRRITMLPGIADLRGNVRKGTQTLLFSTGETFPPFNIPGRIFDWSAQKPIGGAYIEAISRADTTI